MRSENACKDKRYIIASSLILEERMHSWWTSQKVIFAIEMLEFFSSFFLMTSI